MIIQREWLDRETGKIDIEKVPGEVLAAYAQDKEAMLLRHDYTDLLEEFIGESPGVAKLLFALRDYDRSSDKENFEDPDFSSYGEAARPLNKLWQKVKKDTMINYKKWAAARLQARANRQGAKYQYIPPDER
ncbi:MAG: hypothetical protein J6U56_04490 [Spirochaetia bacterium]|nr:hypothetical protein [Spirochaetia bacterium]